MRSSHLHPEKPPKRPSPNSELRNLLDEYAASTVAVPSTSGHLFVSLPSGDRSHSCIPIHDPFLFDWLRFNYLRDFQQFPCDANLYTVRNALATRARFYSAAPPWTIGHRLTTLGFEPESHSIALDLADGSAEAVEISTQGWTITAQSDAHFRPTRSARPLPRPVPATPADLDPLRQLIPFASPADWPRTLVWLLAALRPGGPYPILVLRGPSGAGKSTTARLLRALIDPSTTPLYSLPYTERELHKLAWQDHLLAFDHVAAIPSHLSAALCRLATGVGCLLHEPGNRYPLPISLRRPILLSTNGPLRLPPDLAARTLTVILQPPQQPRPESDLQREFDTLAPRIMGALCSALGTALSRIDATHVQTARLPEAAAGLQVEFTRTTQLRQLTLKRYDAWPSPDASLNSHPNPQLPSNQPDTAIDHPPPHTPSPSVINDVARPLGCRVETRLDLGPQRPQEPPPEAAALLSRLPGYFAGRSGQAGRKKIVLEHSRPPRPGVQYQIPANPRRKSRLRD